MNVTSFVLELNLIDFEASYYELLDKLEIGVKYGLQIVDSQGKIIDDTITFILNSKKDPDFDAFFLEFYSDLLDCVYKIHCNLDDYYFDCCGKKIKCFNAVQINIIAL